MSTTKTLFALALACTLAACDPHAEQVVFPVLPDALKDCTFHYVSSGGNGITVARCPNSTTSTTYPSGKTKRTSVVIDGAEYVRQERSHD